MHGLGAQQLVAKSATQRYRTHFGEQQSMVAIT